MFSLNKSPKSNRFFLDEARRPVVVCQNGHSMCRECMGRSGKAGRGTCPECNEPMVSSPVVNRALCNVIEAFEEA